MITTINPLLEEETGVNESREDLKRASERGHALYLAATGAFFVALFVIFLFLPRPTFSELEKRELATFPNIEDYFDNLSEYPAGISTWFSDTEPYRDVFLTMSMGLRNSMKYNFRSEDETVSFIAQEGMEQEVADEFEDVAETEGRESNTVIPEESRVGNRGIIVTGTAPNARAMTVYGGGEDSGHNFVSVVNDYAAAFPNSKVYVVIANTGGAFYMPEKVTRNKPQTATLNKIQQTLSPGVNYVDVYSTLNAHKAEDIYMRTDHHWSPLAAYYAAKAFANKAGVPFKSLDTYDKHVIHDYVGSMYGFSKDINIKKSPEDFIYYTPTGVDYKAEFITIKTNSNFQVTSESAPVESPYFKTYGDGNGNAYCTFMGGDHFLVHVKTSTPTNRRLLVIKDSYGNALPGYLFYSFSDIFVADFRYFNKNMKKYVADNAITDIAFVFNIFNVCNSATFNKVRNFLSQPDGQLAADTPSETAKSKKETDSKSKESGKPKAEKKAEKKIATETSAPTSPQEGEVNE